MTENAPVLQETFDEESWMSSYGFITASRILGRFNVVLDGRDLIKALRNKQSFFHGLVELPLRHILNDVIYQQAKDYQLYAQKLFVDYLLSGETAKPDSSPGNYTREELESLREALTEHGPPVEELEFTHQQLVSDTHKTLIKHTKRWNANGAARAAELKAEYDLALSSKRIQEILSGIFCYIDSHASRTDLQNALDTVLEKYDELTLPEALKEDIMMFSEEQLGFSNEALEGVAQYQGSVEDIHFEVKRYRKVFYDIILKTNELLYVLPEYSKDPEEDEKNKESLHFDSTIGEDTTNDGAS